MKSGLILLSGFLSVVIGFALSIDASGNLKPITMLFAIASCLLLVRWQKSPRRLLGTLMFLNLAVVALGAVGYVFNPAQEWVSLTLTTAMVMAFGGLAYLLIKALLHGSADNGAVRH